MKKIICCALLAAGILEAKAQANPPQLHPMSVVPAPRFPKTKTGQRPSISLPNQLFPGITNSQGQVLAGPSYTIIYSTPISDSLVYNMPVVPLNPSLAEKMPVFEPVKKGSTFVPEKMPNPMVPGQW